MTGKKARPEHTYALVVGIEKYEARALPDLDGTVSDSLRFAAWLRRRGVPLENVLLHLSPLDANASLMDGWPGVAPATHTNIENALTRTLHGAIGDLLWV